MMRPCLSSCLLALSLSLVLRPARSFTSGQSNGQLFLTNAGLPVHQIQDAPSSAAHHGVPCNSGHPLCWGLLKQTRLRAAEGDAEVASGGESKPKKQPKSQPPPPQIDVSKLDVRVGVITKAWVHEDADKLFCEEIDIGEETGPRSIASGLRAHYDLDDLEGQRVLVLANLKTRKLAGFPSHGMVLCAATDDGLVVKFLEPPTDAALGDRVTVEGYEGDPATENQVQKKKMLDKIFPDLKTNADGVATYKGVPLLTDAGPCMAQGDMANAAIS